MEYTSLYESSVLKKEKKKKKKKKYTHCLKLKKGEKKIKIKNDSIFQKSL
jgi:hypothetical protein